MFGMAAWVERVKHERLLQVAESAPEAAKAFRPTTEDERNRLLLDRAAFELVLWKETDKQRYYCLAIPISSGWHLSGPPLPYAAAESERIIVQRAWRQRSVGLVRVEPMTGRPWCLDDSWQERLSRSPFARRADDARLAASASDADLG